MSVEELGADVLSGNLTNAEARLADWWHSSVLPVIHSDEKVAEQMFAAAISAVAEQLTGVGMKIVADAVGAAETTGLPGAQKFANAVAAIEADLSAANIKSVASQTVTVAVEAAVAQLNAPVAS